MVCQIHTISGNVVGLSVAKEKSLKVLPDEPVWRDRSVNSYTDFGGEIATVASDPINESRQNLKGTITDVNASGGYNADMSNHMDGEMEAFMFAEADRRASNFGPQGPIEMDGTKRAVTNVTAGRTYTFNALLASANMFRPGMLVQAGNFTSAANNFDIAKVTSATSTSVTVDGAGAAESSPPKWAQIMQVGAEIPSANMQSVKIINGDELEIHTIADASFDLSLQHIKKDDWLFIGGDDDDNKLILDISTEGGTTPTWDRAGVFTTGFGKVKSTPTRNGADVYLTLTDLIWEGAARRTSSNDPLANSAQTVQVFMGIRINNGIVSDDIKCHSYQLERSLGQDSASGENQFEYLVGAVPNEMTLNLPTTDKHTIDIGYLALDTDFIQGGEGKKAGTAVAAIAATGSIQFTGNPTATDTLTINGTTFTFVTSGANATQILTAATLPLTLDNIINKLNGSLDASVAAATYSEDGVDTLTIIHDTTGAGGNAFSLDATIAAGAVPSGATLSNGADAITATDNRNNHFVETIPEPYNTSSSVYALQMKITSGTYADKQIFEYASDATITINNNASVVKAVGTLGGIDVVLGNFVVGGNITAYFRTVDAVRAVRENSDVAFTAILAQNNQGVIYDIPLLRPGGGRITVEKNAPITIPVETFAAKSESGYTMSYTSFHYLPKIAMPE